MSITTAAGLSANEQLLVKMFKDYTYLHEHNGARLLCFADRGRWLLRIPGDNILIIFHAASDGGSTNGKIIHLRTSFPLSRPPSEECLEDIKDETLDQIRLVWSEKKESCQIEQELDMDSLEGERYFHEQINTFLFIAKRLAERTDHC